VGVPVQGGRSRLEASSARRFASERDAAEALERELERLLREQRVARSLTLGQLVEVYLAQHDVDPVTIEKLRWLLGKAVAVFGERPVGELRSEEIAAWRIALSPGYRFDATQALRQVLARAVLWGMIDLNPAKRGVDNPSLRRREQRPFESWAELDAVSANLAPRYRPMVIFEAATGLRPAELRLRARRGRAPPPLRGTGPRTRALEMPRRAARRPDLGRERHGVAAAASSSRCQSRSRAAMAAERVLDTVQVHPSDWDARTLDIGSADRDHRNEARQQGGSEGGQERC
jgi:hypothetical protein